MLPGRRDSAKGSLAEKTGGAAAARARFRRLRRFQTKLIIEVFLARAATRGRPHRSGTCSHRRCGWPRSRCGRPRWRSRSEGRRPVNSRRRCRRPVHLRSCRNGRWAIHALRRRDGSRSVGRRRSRRPSPYDALFLRWRTGDRCSLPCAPLLDAASRGPAGAAVSASWRRNGPTTISCDAG